MPDSRMSKIAGTSTVKSPVFWDPALTDYLISSEDNGWRASIGMVVPLDGIENELVNWILAEIKTGRRQSFTTITYHDTIQMVETGIVTCKGKQIPQGKDLHFNEILHAAKAELHELGHISDLLMAKLIKFQIITLKLQELKDSSLGSPTKSDKRAGSIKPADVEIIEPIRQHRLKYRNDPPNEIIVDVPISGPSMYVLLFGFHDVNIIKMLDSIHVHIDTIIKVGLYKDVDFLSEDVFDSSSEDFKQYQFSGPTEVDKILNETLINFWKSLDSIFLDADSTSKLNDVIFQELEIQSSDVPSILCSTDVRESFRAALYTKLSHLMYYIQDLKRQHKNWLNHVKFTHIPSYTDQREEMVNEVLRDLNLGPDEEIPHKLDFQYPVTRHYHSLMDKIPMECVSVTILLNCMIEQIVDTETKQGKDVINIRTDTPEENVAENMEKVFQDYTRDYTAPFQYLPTVSNYTPILINFGDAVRSRIYHLKNRCIGFEKIYHSMIMKNTVLQAVADFPSISKEHRLAQLARYHNLLSLFKAGHVSEAEIDWFLKIFAFESMALQYTDGKGDIKKPTQYSMPWDDPFSLTELPTVSTTGIGKKGKSYDDMIGNAALKRRYSTTSWLNCLAPASDLFDHDCDCHLKTTIKPVSSNITEKTDLKDWKCLHCLKTFEQVASSRSSLAQSLFKRNLQEFTYVEYFPPNVFQQILHAAKMNFQCVDVLFYKRDVCNLLVLHNPSNNYKFSRVKWKSKLNTNLKLRNFQLYVLKSIKNWIDKEEANYRQYHKLHNSLNKRLLHTASSTTFVTPQFSLSDLIGQPEWVPQMITNSLKFKHSEKQPPVKVFAHDVVFMENDFVKLGVREGLKTEGDWKNLKIDESHSASTRQSRRESRAQQTTEDEKFPFKGYDVGNVLLHAWGSENFVYPGKFTEIRVEKYQYLEGRSRVKLSVHNFQNQIFAHLPILDQNNFWPAYVHVYLANGLKIYPAKIYSSSANSSENSFVSSLVKEDFNKRISQSTKSASSDHEPSIFSAQNISPSISVISHSKENQVLLTVTLPTNLSVQIVRDLESNDYLIRQFYQDAPEIGIEDELCRTVTLKGSVIRTLRDQCSEVLQPDGAILKTDWKKFEDEISSDESPEFTGQFSDEKDVTIVTKSTFVKDDKKTLSTTDSHQNFDEKSVYEQAVSSVSKSGFPMQSDLELESPGPMWHAITRDGRQFEVQLGTGVYKKLENKLACFAVDPGTKEQYLTRDDGLHSTIKQEYYLVAHHYEGTRITTYYKKSRQYNKIRVEHPKFVTVLTNLAERNFEILFPRDVNLTVNSYGSCIVHERNGTEFAFYSDGTVLFLPSYQSNPNVTDSRSFDSIVICPHKEVVLETFNDQGEQYKVKSSGQILAFQPSEEVHEIANRRYFIAHSDGGGSELIHEKEMDEMFERAQRSPLMDVDISPLQNNINIDGIQVFRPLPSSWLDSWQNSYEMDSIIPSGLTCKDLQPVAWSSSKGKYTFGYNVGNGLDIYTLEKQVSFNSRKFEYPKIWQVRSFLNYRKITPEIRSIFEEKLKEFSSLMLEIEKQKQDAKPVDTRPVNEQQLSASLLALAKATGLSRKKLSVKKEARKPAGTKVKHQDTVKLSIRKKLFKNNPIHRLYEEIYANQKYLSDYRRTNSFPPYFQCQLGKEALLKIGQTNTKPRFMEKYGHLQKTPIVQKKLTLPIKETSPPLLKDKRTKKQTKKKDDCLSAKLNQLIPPKTKIIPSKKKLPQVPQIQLPSWANVDAFLPVTGEVKRAKFLMRPKKIDFGTVIEGTTLRHRVYLKNDGIESSAVKIRQPPKKTGLSVFCSPLLVLPGMQATMDVEIHALMPLTVNSNGEGSIYYELEILTDLETIYLPISAKIVVGNDVNSPGNFRL